MKENGPQVTAQPMQRPLQPSASLRSELTHGDRP